MNEVLLYRVGALLFGISGAINVFADVLRGTDLLNLAGVACGLLGLPAFYLAHRQGAGASGLAAALVAGIGLVGISGFLFTQAAVFPSLEPGVVKALLEGSTGVAIFGSVILYVLGVLSLAVTGWRAGVHPKPPLALWGIATLPTPAALALPPLVMTLAEAVSGFAVAWIAIALWRQSPSLGDR